MKEDETTDQKTENTTENEPEKVKPEFTEDNIDEVRKRLYARGGEGTSFKRHELPKREGYSDVVRKEPVHETPTEHAHTTPQDEVAVTAASSDSATLEAMPKKRSRNKFRIVAISVAGVFFLGAMIISSMLLFWEGSTISGENISIAAAGSSTVGGGDVYEFQISIANQNTVPIKSAYLIIEYPDGTLAPDGSDSSLTIKRESLGEIASGEVINVSPKARIFGEENEEKEIKARIEYRVEGSNATFERHADPIRLRVSTSPVILSLDAVDRISSGQEIEFDLVIKSNSNETLENMLVKVSYPNGFDFTDSSVETVSGEDTWSINELEPNQEETITIKGLLTGNENDVRRFTASIGVPRDGGLSQIASQLGMAEAEVLIEQALLNVDVNVNGSSQSEIVVGDRDDVDVRITYKNTLDTVIYDGKVSVALSGNAVKEYDMNTSDGQYSSQANTIVWDGASIDDLQEILPGQEVSLRFVLEPTRIDVRTPEVVIDISTEGSSFREEESGRNLMGETTRVVKVEGRPDLDSMTVFEEGPFVNAGPVPPVAEETTQYTYVFVVEAGVNDLADAEVTAKLPAGVTWLDLVTDGDTFSFNPSSRVLTWEIGSLDANREARASAQVSFKPTLNQVGRIPVILETQQLKATDRFTGTTVRDTAPALTTNYTGDRNDKDGVARVVEE